MIRTAWFLQLIGRVLLLAFAGALTAVVLTVPAEFIGLSVAVNDKLAASGVSNRVTAVLINFRGFDTLLEISVLALAAIAVWSLGTMPRRRSSPSGLVLSFLVRLLIPFLVLLSGYMLWAGASRPGGAFQAGALLAAAGLLWLLSDLPLSRQLGTWPLRLTLCVGPLTFIACGAAFAALGANFLQYPATHAKYWILLIEFAAMLSIGYSLVAVFRGGRPGQNQEHE